MCCHFAHVMCVSAGQLSLQASVPASAACGHVHRVLCAVALMGNACVVIEELFSRVPVAVVIGFDALSEDVVVLKGTGFSGFSHWFRAHCQFHMSPRIWNTFDGLVGALILSPLILLK